MVTILIQAQNCWSCLPAVPSTKSKSTIQSTTVYSDRRSSTQESRCRCSTVCSISRRENEVHLR